MLITISREFGSGGRELGKRLSEVLEIPCYDKEIIQMIAEKQGFDEQYISHMSERNLQTWKLKKIVPMLAEYVRLWFEIGKTI